MLRQDVLQKRPTTPTLKIHTINYLKNETKSFDYTLSVLTNLEAQTRAEIARLGGNKGLEAIMDLLHVPSPEASWVDGSWVGHHRVHGTKPILWLSSPLYIMYHIPSLIFGFRSLDPFWIRFLVNCLRRAVSWKSTDISVVPIVFYMNSLFLNWKIYTHLTWKQLR